MKPASTHIASLLQSLTHEDKAVARAAVEALVRLGPDSMEVQDSLENLLHELDSNKRWPVAYALAQLNTPPVACLDILVDALGHEDADIRWATVVVLSRLGKSDDRVFPRLADLLITGGSVHKRMAVYCLRYLGLKRKAILRVLHQTLQDPDPMVRVAVVNTLAEHPPADKETLTVLRYVLLQDTDTRVRHAAEFALQRLSK